MTAGGPSHDARRHIGHNVLLATDREVLRAFAAWFTCSFTKLSMVGMLNVVCCFCMCVFHSSLYIY